VSGGKLVLRSDHGTETRIACRDLAQTDQLEAITFFNYAWDPFCLAAYLGEKAAVEQFLRQGTNVNHQPLDTGGRTRDGKPAPMPGPTALQAAAEGGHAELVRHLLKAGAKVDPVGYRSTLHCAVNSGNIEVINLILDAGADVRAVSPIGGMTALHAAAASGNAPICSLLLDRGADVNALDAGAHTAWERALARGHPEVGELLLARGAMCEGRTQEFLDCALGQSSKTARDALRGIVVPAMDFRQTPFARILAWLPQAATNAPPNGGGPFHFVLLGEATNVTEKVTFRARDVALLEALNIITDISGLSWAVCDRTVVFVCADTPPLEILAALRRNGLLPPGPHP
jgi:hypothetical protein